MKRILALLIAVASLGLFLYSSSSPVLNVPSAPGADAQLATPNAQPSSANVFVLNSPLLSFQDQNGGEMKMTPGTDYDSFCFGADMFELIKLSPEEKRLVNLIKGANDTNLAVAGDLHSVTLKPGQTGYYGVRILPPKRGEVTGVTFILTTVPISGVPDIVNNYFKIKYVETVGGSAGNVKDGTTSGKAYQVISPAGDIWFFFAFTAVVKSGGIRTTIEPHFFGGPHITSVEPQYIQCCCEHVKTPLIKVPEPTICWWYGIPYISDLYVWWYKYALYCKAVKNTENVACTHGEATGKDLVIKGDGFNRLRERETDLPTLITITDDCGSVARVTEATIVSDTEIRAKIDITVCRPGQKCVKISGVGGFGTVTFLKIVQDVPDTIVTQKRFTAVRIFGTQEKMQLTMTLAPGEDTKQNIIYAGGQYQIYNVTCMTRNSDTQMTGNSTGLCNNILTGAIQGTCVPGEDNQSAGNDWGTCLATMDNADINLTTDLDGDKIPEPNVGDGDEMVVDGKEIEEVPGTPMCVGTKGREVLITVSSPSEGGTMFLELKQQPGPSPVITVWNDKVKRDPAANLILGGDGQVNLLKIWFTKVGPDLKRSIWVDGVNPGKARLRIVYTDPSGTKTDVINFTVSDIQLTADLDGDGKRDSTPGSPDEALVEGGEKEVVTGKFICKGEDEKIQVVLMSPSVKKFKIIKNPTVGVISVYAWPSGFEVDESFIDILKTREENGNIYLTLDVSGTNVGVAELTVVYTDDKGFCERTDTVKFTVQPCMDIDADLNGNGDYADTDEAKDNTGYGKIILVNNDDDNADGRQDHTDSVPNGDGDLGDMAKIRLRGTSNDGITSGKVVVEISDPSIVRVFNQEKTEVLGPAAGARHEMALSALVGASVSDLTWYVEGLLPGQVVMTLKIEGSSDAIPIKSDEVLISVVLVDLKNEAEIFNKNIREQGMQTVLPINEFARGNPGGVANVTLQGPSGIHLNVKADFLKIAKYQGKGSDTIEVKPVIPEGGEVKVPVEPIRRPADEEWYGKTHPKRGFGVGTGKVTFLCQLAESGQETYQRNLTLGLFEITLIPRTLDSSTGLLSGFHLKSEFAKTQGLAGGAKVTVPGQENVFLGGIDDLAGGETAYTRSVFFARTARRDWLSNGYSWDPEHEDLFRANSNIPIVCVETRNVITTILADPAYWFGSPDNTIRDCDLVLYQRFVGDCILDSRVDSSIGFSIVFSFVLDKVVAYYLPFTQEFAFQLLMAIAKPTIEDVQRWLFGGEETLGSARVRYGIQGNWRRVASDGATTYRSDEGGSLDGHQGVTGELKNALTASIKNFPDNAGAEQVLIMSIRASSGTRQGNVLVAVKNGTQVMYTVNGVVVAIRSDVQTSAEITVRYDENVHVVKEIETR